MRYKFNINIFPKLWDQSYATIIQKKKSRANKYGFETGGFYTGMSFVRPCQILSHLDSVAIHSHKDDGDNHDGGDGHGDNHHDQERRLGHQVLLDNVLQEAEAADLAAFAPSVAGVKEHDLTEP